MVSKNGAVIAHILYVWEFQGCRGKLRARRLSKIIVTHKLVMNIIYEYYYMEILRKVKGEKGNLQSGIMVIL